MTEFIKLSDRIDFPQWASCLHEYGDIGGLSEESVQKYEEWLNSIQRYYESLGVSSVSVHITDREVGFVCYPAFGESAMCVEAEVWGRK